MLSVTTAKEDPTEVTDVRADAHDSRVRAALGVFLFIHFAQLLPWAPELFSNVGMLADGSASPLLRVFANPLALFDSPLFTQVFVASGALASLVLLFGTGRRKRIAALYLWFVLTCLFGRNPLIRNPSLPYVGVLLLVYAASPKRPDVTLVRVVWVLLALGYAYSGITKLAAPSWVDGHAITAILHNPLARSNVARDLLLALPSGVLVVASYGTLILEITFPLLALSKKTRPFAWFAMSSMHVALLLLIDFADLTWGMLLVHAFVFDPRWLSFRRPHHRHLIPCRNAGANSRDGGLHGRPFHRLLRVDEDAHGQGEDR